MNKKVLICFVLGVGVILGGIPMVGQLANRQGVVEASATPESVEFAWNENTLAGTGWNQSFQVPIKHKLTDYGVLDVDMVVEFLPNNRIKLTTHVFSQGPITPYTASLIEKYTSTQEADCNFLYNDSIKTTLKNPLHGLNAGLFITDFNLRIEEGNLQFEGEKVGRKLQHYEAKRFF